VLFGTSGAMRAKGIGIRKRDRAAAPAPAAGQLPRRPAAASGLDDMDDIEAILKKHGIS
jgi:hypothetical protein